MAKLVVLWQAGASVRIGQAEARALARLGVTSIGLVRDDRTVGVVLDGWAFDPTRQAEAAATTLCSEPSVAQLLPVAEIGVANASMEGEPDDPNPPHAGRLAGGRHSAGG